MEDGKHTVKVKPYTCQGSEGFTVLLEGRVRNWVGIQLHLPKQAGLYLMFCGIMDSTSFTHRSGSALDKGAFGLCS